MKLANGIAFSFTRDAGLGPHADQRLADLLVVDVAVVRAVERELEAVRIAGLGEQLLRAAGIVRADTLSSSSL